MSHKPINTLHAVFPPFVEHLHYYASIIDKKIETAELKVADIFVGGEFELTPDIFAVMFEDFKKTKDHRFLVEMGVLLLHAYRDLKETESKLN